MSMDYTPFLFPLVGGAIGYLTNYVAVKMLFRPHRRIGIGPLAIQGLLPKRRNAISEGIAATVEDELISMQDLSAVLKELDLGPLIDDLVDGSFDTAQYNGKSEIMSRLNTTINAYLRSKVKRSINSNKDEIINEFIHEIEKHVDFKEIIIKNIEAYDLDQLEDIVLRVSAGELKYITIIGGVLGFIMGLVQMAIYMAK